MSRSVATPFAWRLAMPWVAIGALVSIGLSGTVRGGLLVAFVGCGLGVWLLWTHGPQREEWSALIGAAAGPLTLMWSERDFLCLGNSATICPAINFDWTPWITASVVLLGAGTSMIALNSRRQTRRE